MAGQRGLYRSVHCSLVDDPEYQEFSPGARHTLMTLRTCRDCTIAGIFRYYLIVLLEQTGYSSDEQEKHLAELEAADWIRRDGTVLWIKNALRYEPNISLKNQKHIEGVCNHLRALPKTKLLAQFLEHYPETVSEDLSARSKALPKPDDKVMGIDSHSHGYGMGIDRDKHSKRVLSSESESESESGTEKSARANAPILSPDQKSSSRKSDQEPDPLSRVDHQSAGHLAKWVKDQLVKRSPQGAPVFEPEIINGLLKIKAETRYSWQQISTVIKWAAGQEFWIEKLRALQRPVKRKELPEWFESMRGQMRTADSRDRGQAEDTALEERTQDRRQASREQRGDFASAGDVLSAALGGSDD